MDSRYLYAISNFDPYPMPRIYYLFLKSRWGRVHHHTGPESKVTSSWLWQQRKELTAFGMYQYKVMPFGLIGGTSHISKG